MIWRHCHGDHCETHSHDAQLKHNKSGSLVLIGDLSHNFIDGILIASAFIYEFQLGLVTALAIYAHQIPQEMGNISIFVHKGLEKSKAILLNVVANISMTLGAVITYILIDSAGDILPVLLAFTASNLIYVAVSDLIPGLHKKTELRESVMQISMILVGVIIVYIFHLFLH